MSLYLMLVLVVEVTVYESLNNICVQDDIFNTYIILKYWMTEIEIEGKKEKKPNYLL